MSGAKSKFNELMSVAAVNGKRREKGLPVKEGVKHLVLEGPAGTGKTTFANAIASAYYGLGLVDKPKVTRMAARELVARYAAQSTEQVTDFFDEAAGGVLFLDEAYGLVQSDDDTSGREALTQFVKLADERKDTVIVLAGYDDTLSKLNEYNSGMDSRFPPSGRIQLAEYKKKDMARIGMRFVEEAGFRMDKGTKAALRKAVSDQTGNARGAGNFVDAVRDAASVRLIPAGKSEEDFTVEELSRVTLADVKAAKRTMAASARRKKLKE